jgi:hypothetical protein
MIMVQMPGAGQGEEEWINQKSRRMVIVFGLGVDQISFVSAGWLAFGPSVTVDDREWCPGVVRCYYENLQSRENS